MADRRFGEVPGVRVGDVFADRASLAKAGVHKPTQAGISGSGYEGADSIVLSGGYEDDEDYGDEIVYTGHGGKDQKTGRQVKDQTLTVGNLALARSQLEGLPVRVVRGAELDSRMRLTTATDTMASTSLRSTGVRQAAPGTWFGAIGYDGTTVKHLRGRRNLQPRLRHFRRK